MSNEIVKNLNFGDEGKNKVFEGVSKLTKSSKLHARSKR